MYLLSFEDAGQSELVSRWDWSRLLELADLGGWRPSEPSARMLLARLRRDPGGRVFLGRDRPELPWDNVHVSERDAQALAAALEGLLDDIPNHDAAAEKAPAERDFLGRVRERWVLPGGVLSPIEDFSGERKEVVRQFSSMLRRSGGFQVRYFGSDADPPSEYWRDR